MKLYNVSPLQAQLLIQEPQLNFDMLRRKRQYAVAPLDDKTKAFIEAFEEPQAYRAPYGGPPRLKRKRK